MRHNYFKYLFLLLAVIGLLVITDISQNSIRQAHAADDYEHFMTGYPLSGAHRRVDCDACHVNGIFVGTPTSAIAVMTMQVLRVSRQVI